MFYKSVSFLICVLVLLNRKINPLFVSVGDYPKWVSSGVNRPDCGLRYVPRKHNLTFDNKCFSKTYSDKVFWNIGGEVLAQKKPSVSARVWKGMVTEYSEAPWVVHLGLVTVDVPKPSIVDEGYYKIKINSCTGVLITFEWILTSAHCEPWALVDVEVSAGPNAMEGEEMILANKEKWFIHPEYPAKPKNISSEYDIALIKLKQKFTQKIKDHHFLINPICLPRRWQYNEQPDDAVFYGYGPIMKLAVISLPIFPDNLRKAIIKLDSYSDCRNVLKGQDMFCMNDSGVESLTCKGDSGGPLVQHDDKGTKAILVGILKGVSYRGKKKPENCEERRTVKSHTIFVSVPKFIDWILKTIAEN